MPQAAKLPLDHQAPTLSAASSSRLKARRRRRLRAFPEGPQPGKGLLDLLTQVSQSLRLLLRDFIIEDVQPAFGLVTGMQGC